MPIPNNAVVYCDIPYKNTGRYVSTAISKAFNHEEFYKWALSRDYPVFVSEYDMPQGFTCIASKQTVSCFCPTDTIARVEKLFVQDRFADKNRRNLF